MEEKRSGDKRRREERIGEEMSRGWKRREDQMLFVYKLNVLYMCAHIIVGDLYSPYENVHSCTLQKYPYILNGL
jgi:hypothetical protein